MITVDKCVALEQFRIQTDQLDILSKVVLSALEGFDARGYRTQRLSAAIKNIDALGLESLDPILIDNLRNSIATESSKETRDALVSLGIGARAQQMFDTIIGFLLRLLGSRGQRPADMDMEILTEIRNIQQMKDERITRTRVPEFEHPQFKINWDTQWSSYRDTMAEVDAIYADMSPEEFYLKFSIPRQRALYVSLGSQLMKKGLPVCYLNGDRVRAIARLAELITDTKNSISQLRYIEINEDGTITYDRRGIEETIQHLQDALDKDWEFTKEGHPDWLARIGSSDISQLRRIDGDMSGLENVTNLLARSIRLDERVKVVVNSVNEDEQVAMARAVAANVREWQNQLNTLVRLVGSIYSRLRQSEQLILKTVRQYRRTVDYIVKN